MAYSREKNLETLDFDGGVDGDGEGDRRGRSAARKEAKSSYSFDPSLHQSTIKFTRHWGSYSLNNMDIPRQQILTPFCFDPFADITEYNIKLDALDALEKAFYLLGSQQPESWRQDERLLMYKTLIDYCITTKSFSATVRGRHFKCASKFGDYDESDLTISSALVSTLEEPVLGSALSQAGPAEPVAVADSEVKVSSSSSGSSPRGNIGVVRVNPNSNSANGGDGAGKTVRCMLTKIKAKNCFNELPWRLVPKHYYSVPSIVDHPPSTVPSSSSSLPAVVSDAASASPTATPAAASTGDGASSPREPPSAGPEMAIENALLRLMAARETARLDNRRFIQSLKPQMKMLEQGSGPVVAAYDMEKPLSLRSMPVGYDAMGNSYWLLGAQESMTLYPYESSGAVATSLVPNNAPGSMQYGGKQPRQPCVLVRRANGWWGYHHGNDLGKLLHTFSNNIPCEKILRQCLVERLCFTMRLIMHNTLRIKYLQREWIDRRARAENWLSSLKMDPSLDEGGNTQERVRLAELVWARIF
jgi:hypothetical protein